MDNRNGKQSTILRKKSQPIENVRLDLVTDLRYTTLFDIAISILFNATPYTC